MAGQSAQDEAAIYVARTVYSLNNQMLTRSMKVEVESWYQLPIFVARAAFAVACIAWAKGETGAFGAYLLAAGAGIVVVIFNRLVYIQKLVFTAGFLLGFPWIVSAVLIGVSIWFMFNGWRVQAIALAANTLLLGIPTGLPTMVAQTMVSGSSMHPKWAFAKRRFGIAP